MNTRTITFGDLGEEPEEYECYPGTDIINQPGKFETEPLYVPYFYKFLMHGCGEPVGDTEDDNTERLPIEDVDREQFPDSPELSEHTHINLWETGDGFIFHRLVKL